MSSDELPTNDIVAKALLRHLHLRKKLFRRRKFMDRWHKVSN
jgi:hypothetical protein